MTVKVYLNDISRRRSPLAFQELPMTILKAACHSDSPYVKNEGVPRQSMDVGKLVGGGSAVKVVVGAEREGPSKSSTPPMIPRSPCSL
jgi:hypothetical protein